MQQKRKRETEYHSTPCNPLSYMDDANHTNQPHSNPDQSAPSSPTSTKRAREPSASEDPPYAMSQDDQDDDDGPTANSASPRVGLMGGNAINTFSADSVQADPSQAADPSTSLSKDTLSTEQLLNSDTFLSSGTSDVDTDTPVTNEMFDALDSATIRLSSAAASDSVPPPQQQLEYINRLKDGPMIEGDTWYLIEMRWWQRWEAFCSRASSENPSTKGLAAAPGIITNRELYDDQEMTKVKRALMADVEVKLVPQTAWDALLRW